MIKGLTSQFAFILIEHDAFSGKLGLLQLGDDLRTRDECEGHFLYKSEKKHELQGSSALPPDYAHGDCSRARA